MLTKLEEQVLMTVWRFKDKGYGVNIFHHLEGINEKRITLGVIYDILERLKKNGYLETMMGKSTPERGGMRKRFYQISEKGIETLVRSREVYDKVMDGFSELVDEYNINNS